jgi:hypothetical protein
MAADRERIVTLDASGTATTVKDFNDLTNYYTLRDTFQVRPGAAQPVMAQRQRRYGGASTVAETAENGSIAWTSVVKGATQDNALARAEELFATLRAARRDLYFEWRQGGATSSTFYEVRGPATISPTYSPVMFNDAKAWQVAVEIPVAPLALATPTTISLTGTTLTLPDRGAARVRRSPGSAPALANVTLRTSGGTNPPIWAMIGWTKRAWFSRWRRASLRSGCIEAETGTSLSGWASAADANYRGGNGLKVTASGAGCGVGDVRARPVGDGDRRLGYRTSTSRSMPALISPRRSFRRS